MAQDKFSFPHTTPEQQTRYPTPPGRVRFYEVHPCFSFRHYHHQGKYRFEDFTTRKDFLRFVGKLRDLSQFKWKDILVSQKMHWHAHPIQDWKETAEPNGFHHLDSSCRCMSAYQFKTFEECRVVGFFNEQNVFEIVWVDRFHKIYPRK